MRDKIIKTKLKKNDPSNEVKSKEELSFRNRSDIGNVVYPSICVYIL